MIELVVQYPGDMEWWPVLSVSDGAVPALVSVAKSVGAEGAEVRVRQAGILFDVPEFLELRARLAG